MYWAALAAAAGSLCNYQRKTMRAYCNFCLTETDTTDFQDCTRCGMQKTSHAIDEAILKKRKETKRDEPDLLDVAIGVGIGMAVDSIFDNSSSSSSSDYSSSDNSSSSSNDSWSGDGGGFSGGGASGEW